MHSVILQMAALILCGVAWRILKPGQLDADTTRKVLTSVVYYLLLPALVLKILWSAPLGMTSFMISLLAAAGVLSAIALSSLACRSCRQSKAVTGAVILAASFPNATYMGLPVLENILGETGANIAIQYDLFACTPLLLTVGILLSRHFGRDDRGGHVLTALIKVPPLWAAMAAVIFNMAEIPISAWLDQWLGMLASGVIPLMLFSLGLSLRWHTWHPGQLPALLPVLVLQLFLTPLLVWGLSLWLGLEQDVLTGVVLEAAMPSMVLGIVLCDQYKLDTGLYAAAVTLTTALSLFTLPLWFDLIA
ncbi:AEC family transporter [Thiolapillus brandeum]|uniref:Auxin efflux carrier n=1 Tax=Thiolapillus brandeum TaxID=1076588 RepID=A0A7U6GIJ4_9GAMM|nr:AEC family transporter [Thiolapillus brandeum]BAO44252.1 auxin efflux carrier [Thiolapillus brandeum]